MSHLCSFIYIHIYIYCIPYTVSALCLKTFWKSVPSLVGSFLQQNEQWILTPHFASLPSSFSGNIINQENREDGYKLNSFLQTVYWLSEVQLWLWWGLGVGRGRGWCSGLRVKLHNIYIFPSLVTYFTQTLRINYWGLSLISSLFLRNDINYITQA